MRILFVTPYVPSLIRVRPYQLLAELGRRHEVTVLTLHAGERERADLELLARRHSTVGVHLSRQRALSNCLRALPGRTPLQGAVCRSPQLIRLVREWLEPGASLDGRPAALRGRFDVVHVEHLRAAYLAEAIPASTPAVVDAVDCISLLLARTRRSSHRLRQRLIASLELGRTRRFEGEILDRFDGVAVTSPVDRTALLDLNARLPVTTISNGVDLDAFAPAAGGREADTLVFAGKMSYHANATAARFLAREVLPLVQARRPAARLYVVGNDPPADVRALGEAPGVVVTGYVPDVGAYLRRASVAVAPMIVKVGVQNKILEAMATETPVVTTSAGAEGLSARVDDELRVADGPAGLAAALVGLLDDAGERARLGTAGRSYVERHHSWAAASQQFEELYRAAAATAKGKGPTARCRRPLVG